jgi:hypothetical protein
MSKRVVPVVLCLVAVVLATSLLASPRVTIYFTDGDDEACTLVDYGGAGFTVRVDGEEEVYALGDVAAIDFVGGDIPDAEIDLFKEGQHLVVLRSGNYFYGRLDDIGGTDPLRISFKVRGGIRTVASSDIRRIYLNELE